MSNPTGTKYTIVILDNAVSKDINDWTISDALERYELTVVTTVKHEGKVDLDPEEWG